MPVDNLELAQHAQQIRYIVSNGNALDEFMALSDTVRERLYPVARELFNIAHLRLAQVADLAPAVLAEVREHAQQIRYIVSNGNALDVFMALPDTVREQIYPAAFYLFDVTHLRLENFVHLDFSLLSEVCQHAREISLLIRNGDSLDDFLSLDATVREQIYPAAFYLFDVTHLRLEKFVHLDFTLLSEVCQHAREISLLIRNGDSLDDFLSLDATVRAQIYPAAFQLFDEAHLRLEKFVHLDFTLLSEVCQHAKEIRMLICNGDSLDDFLMLKQSIRLPLYANISAAKRVMDEATVEIRKVAEIFIEGYEQSPKPKENGEIPCSLMSMPLELLIVIGSFCGDPTYHDASQAEIVALKEFLKIPLKLSVK